MTDTITTYRWGVREKYCDPEWERDALVDGALGRLPHTEETARTAVERRYFDVELIRQAEGGEIELVPHEPQPLEPPTLEDLRAVTYAGVPLGFLGEESEWTISFGHVERARMAEAVNAWLIEECGDRSGGGYSPTDVQHVYAVRLPAWGYHDDVEWIIQWSRHETGPYPLDTPGAFLLTIVETS